MTFSEHAAQTRGSIVYYLVTYSIHLLAFYVFIVNWFVPAFRLPTIFTVVTVVAVLGELVALLVPTTGGRKTMVHDAASFLMLALLVPLSGMIAVSHHFTDFVRIFAALVVVVMVGICVLFVFHKSAKKCQLIYQVVYGGSFHLLILFAIITRL